MVLSFGRFGIKVLIFNLRVENVKYIWAWFLSKNKFGESWIKWAWSVLYGIVFISYVVINDVSLSRRANIVMFFLYVWECYCKKCGNIEEK